MDIFRHKQLTRLEGARRPQAHEDIAGAPPGVAQDARPLSLPTLCVPTLCVPTLCVPRLCVPTLCVPALRGPPPAGHVAACLACHGPAGLVFRSPSFYLLTPHSARVATPAIRATAEPPGASFT